MGDDAKISDIFGIQGKHLFSAYELFGASLFSVQQKKATIPSYQDCCSADPDSAVLPYFLVKCERIIQTSSSNASSKTRNNSEERTLFPRSFTFTLPGIYLKHAWRFYHIRSFLCLLRIYPD